MGITYLEAQALASARTDGVSFEEILSVAHLQLFLRADEISTLNQKHPAFGPLQTGPESKFGGYSDDFLRTFLGARSLSILDYSAYENAGIVHDLNYPIGSEYHGRFDAIIDGGSLEHIFNFPVAVANLMRMLKVGGSLFISAPANNLCGHGFYQFSPELMYRVFAPENGFAVKRVLLSQARYPSIERTPPEAIYEVIDPAEAGGRVGLVTGRPVTMFVHAQRTGDAVPFMKFPLQSDYKELWSSGGPALDGSTQSTFARVCPEWLKDIIRGRRELRMYSFSNRRWYKRIA